MKLLYIFTFLIFLSCAQSFKDSVSSNKPCNGGYACISCTVLVGLGEQLAQFHNSSVASALDRLCNYFPKGEFQRACHDIVRFFGPVVEELLYVKYTPDAVCHSMKFCYTNPGYPPCHLFPEPLGGLEKHIERAKKVVKRHEHKLKYVSSDVDIICKIPGINFICHIINKMETTFRPVWDKDGDGFSIMETLRGSNWRGKDCNDLASEIYPGIKPVNHDIEYDSNCNGIYGVDSDSGRPYEDLLCEGTDSRGIIVLGDSASAHFHIPKAWVIPSQIGKDVFAHLPYVLENELDWPMMSAITGYKNITWPIIEGPVRSLYLKLRERNRCNHRDYQNLGVNGADCIKLQNYQLSLMRDKFKDKPVFLTYALVGNDVCNGMKDDTLAYMTTVEQMRENVLKTMNFLDDLLPKGSSVIITGLADGRVLYDSLHQRIHPLGNQNKDVTYTSLYDYLNCLGISPCSGWMNSNATLRNLTSERAMNLSRVLSDVAVKYRYNFSSFELNYVDCPLQAVIREWEKKHGTGTLYELIDPMDGFHPNQLAEALIADYGWDYLLKNHPSYVGKINPNNQKIKDTFGDQGGH